MSGSAIWAATIGFDSMGLATSGQFRDTDCGAGDAKRERYTSTTSANITTMTELSRLETIYGEHVTEESDGTFTLDLDPWAKPLKGIPTRKFALEICEKVYEAMDEYGRNTGYDY